jgi:hypothetical protein
MLEGLKLESLPELSIGQNINSLTKSKIIYVPLTKRQLKKKE